MGGLLLAFRASTPPILRDSNFQSSDFAVSLVDFTTLPYSIYLILLSTLPYSMAAA